MDYDACESRINRELVSLSRFSNPEDASWRNLKALFICTADTLVNKVQAVEPPIDLDRVKKIRKITQQITFGSPKGPDAILSPTEEGFVLRLKGGQHNFRHRFSIAHEIGHTFFYNLNASPPKRFFISRARVFINKEENICSAFARELLIPRIFISKELTRIYNNKDKIGTIVSIARKFEVSLEVMIWRLFRDLSEMQNSAAILKIAEESVYHTTRTYYGVQIRKYVRKKEKDAINQATEILRNGPPYDNLSSLADRYDNIIEVHKHESASGSQAIVLLGFKR